MSARSGGITEVAYVCSPDHWEHLLFASIRSLLSSGTSFDRLVIHCVGKRPAHWEFLDPRLVVREVEPIIPGYFLSNKIHVCQSDADRLVYLDSDTLVLRCFDDLLHHGEDLVARPASRADKPQWDRRYWEEVLRRAGAPCIPYFNAGFFILRNEVQHKLGPRWRECLEGGLSGAWFDPGRLHGRNFAEQLAFSVALGSIGGSWRQMSPADHAFGWEREPWRPARVFHTGGWAFWRHAPLIEPRLGIAWKDLPQFRRSGVMNPVHRHRFKQNVLLRPCLEIPAMIPHRLLRSCLTLWRRARRSAPTGAESRKR